jgi:hypothetical protein
MKKVISLFFNLLGFEILTKKNYNRIYTERVPILNHLLSTNTHNLKEGLSCIVFSKDRSIQLFALLESYNNNIDEEINLTVIYNVSNEDHKKSYEELIILFSKTNKKINFVLETKTFKNSLLKVLQEVQTKNMFFLTDDDLFIRKFNTELVSNINTADAIFSLRFNPELTYSFTAGTKIERPHFQKYKNYENILSFKWFEKKFDWSDPWSVNGHIFATNEVLVLSTFSDFLAPNSYETKLKNFNDLIENRVGLCFKESIIINLPINLVQTEVQNNSGNISPLFLLKQWNLGKKIDILQFQNCKIKSTHEIHKVHFVNR